MYEEICFLNICFIFDKKKDYMGYEINERSCDKFINDFN